MNIFCYFLFIIACKCQLFVDQIHVESYNGFLRDTAANQSKATVKIAVIGGGAAGTSFCHYLNKHIYKEIDSEIKIELKLFEKTDRIGGRAKSHRLEYINCIGEKCGIESMNIEQGASIFAEKNFNMVNATKEFNLTLVDLTDKPDADQKLGVWDGEWRFLENGNDRTAGMSWWSRLFNKAKFFWRYGRLYGPLKARNLAKESADKYLQIYDILVSGNTFDSIDSVVQDIGLSGTISTSAADYYTKSKVNSLFADEILGGLARNTYGQTLDEIHAMGSLIAFYSASYKMFNVEGGNDQVFQRMIEHNVDVKLNSAIKRINKTPNGKYTLDEGNDEIFDYVVIATPLQNLILPGHVQPDPAPYVTVHSTIIVGSPSLDFFKIKSVQEFPEIIFVPSSSQNSNFNSLGVKKWVNGTASAILKIFSPENLTDAVLNEMFHNVSTVVRQEWKAYPYLCVKQKDWKAPIKLDDNGLFYANRMEEFISTMETETVAGRNIANWIWKDLNK